jgi:hypothetical protein
MSIRWGAALAILCAASSARADDISRADQLFTEGKALMETDLNGGCAKLDQSLALNPQAVGTLLNVALCDARLGKLATAVAHFTRARDMAREQGMKEHLEAAEAHLAALMPRVPHVTLKLADPRPGTQIVVDDKLVPQDRWADVLLDPGQHPVVVSAPGRVTFRTTIKIAEGERHDIAIPALAVAEGPGRTIGKISAVTGGALIATGVVLGVIAGRRYDDAFSAGCLVREGVTRCDDASYDKIQSARSLGVAGSVVGGIGVVAAGVGVYLWLRNPRHSEHAIAVVPQVDRDGGGLAAVGRF